MLKNIFGHNVDKMKENIVRICTKGDCGGLEI
jgi:hypothetical protein